MGQWLACLASTSASLASKQDVAHPVAAATGNLQPCCFLLPFVFPTSIKQLCRVIRRPQPTADWPLMYECCRWSAERSATLSHNYKHLTSILAHKRDTQTNTRAKNNPSTSAAPLSFLSKQVHYYTNYISIICIFFKSVIPDLNKAAPHEKASAIYLALCLQPAQKLMHCCIHIVSRKKGKVVTEIRERYQRSLWHHRGLCDFSHLYGNWGTLLF